MTPSLFTFFKNIVQYNPLQRLLSQRSLHYAPIFRLLLKVAVKGTHQCDFFNFCGAFGPQHKADTCLYATGFLCKHNRDPRLPLSMLLVNFYKIKLLFSFLASGHTASNAPDLFRTPKLSGAGPGQYRGGGPPGKPLGCCWLLLISLSLLLLFVIAFMHTFSGWHFHTFPSVST